MIIARRTFLCSLASLALTKPLFAASQSYGLIFVGASWCGVCKRAAPILALFSEATGVDCLVASADARPIAPFTSFVPAKGHPIADQVQKFPTTLAFDASAKTIVGSYEGFRNEQSYLALLKNWHTQLEKAR